MHTLAPSTSDLLFTRAIRRSRVIRFVRLLLILLVLLLSVIFVVRATIGFWLSAPSSFGDISLEHGKLVMDSPRISGYAGDSSNRYYDVRAFRAVEDVTNPGFITLEQIDARFADTPEGELLLTASTGVFDVSRERLTLNGLVHITGERGMVMTLSDALLDIRLGRLFSSRPVRVIYGDNELTANSLTIEDHGASITFGNDVRMVLHSGSPLTNNNISE